MPNSPKPILESEVWRFGNAGGISSPGEIGVLDRLGKPRLGSLGGVSSLRLTREDEWDLVKEGRCRDGNGGGWSSVGQDGVNVGGTVD